MQCHLALFKVDINCTDKNISLMSLANILKIACDSGDLFAIFSERPQILFEAGLSLLGQGGSLHFQLVLEYLDHRHPAFRLPSELTHSQVGHSTQPLGTYHHQLVGSVRSACVKLEELSCGRLGR